jgi:Trypsin-co-occurring domain 2
VNLAEFIDETLSEILAGIRAAQKREGGEAVGAKFTLPRVESSVPGSSNLFSSYDSGAFTVVDFDVSVVAETTKGGKGGIRVMSIGAEGGAERKSHESSRVKFAVPVQIPEVAQNLSSSGAGK